MVKGMKQWASKVFLMMGMLMLPAVGWAADACPASKARIDAIDPLIKGAIAALQISGHPRDMSGLSFKREDGSDV